MDIEALYREERPRALATLIRLLGDFDLAEDALQDAFAEAVAQWPASGPPRSPLPWLVSTARFKAIDRLRRDKRLAAHKGELAARGVALAPAADESEGALPDDVLRLIFTCCHPALATVAQVALTLKTLCGLSVEEIARAFLVAPATMAQRLVRAKGKIRAAGIPYEVPDASHVAERLDGVLRVVYLVFNEGYAATTGDALVRRELCAEAIRLGRLLRALLPASGEVAGLLALMLLTDARREARLDRRGELVVLEDQDRARWDAAAIAEGLALAEEAARSGPGFYAIQAAIAAVHAQAPRAEDTDWRQIAALYAALRRIDASPVVALNHAAAIAMAEGPERGLALVLSIESSGALDGYHLLPAAKADLLRRLGRMDEAEVAYRRALRLVTNVAERRYLERRVREVATRSGTS
jgi:RNA polymerase sigma-70 factor (ECF subfamily)